MLLNNSFHVNIIQYCFVKNKDNASFNVQKIKSYGVPEGNQGGKVKYHKDDKSTYSIVSCLDWWNMSMLSTTYSERLRCQTQKPLELMNKIVKILSNKGDIVLDPFCGCATTLEASENLFRRWIGIDVSTRVAELIK